MANGRVVMRAPAWCLGGVADVLELLHECLGGPLGRKGLPSLVVQPTLALDIRVLQMLRPAPDLTGTGLSQANQI